MTSKKPENVTESNPCEIDLTAPPTAWDVYAAAAIVGLIVSYGKLTETTDFETLAAGAARVADAMWAERPAE